MATHNFSQYFPDYEILSQIGLANARVLKASHRPTGELVAIKHYPINANEETLARFQRESEIMIQVDHPNVVKIREVHLDASLPYIVMDYIQGGDVRSLLREKGSLEVPTVIQLGQQMAEALREIHEKGIIHRDIKPDNILYQKMSNGQLHFLLTDFGISRLRESQDATITGQSPMTPEYACPEQFEDSKKVSFAADYYSLGVVLYECLTGQVPFSMGTRGIVSFYRVLEKEAPPALVLAYGYPLPETLNFIVEKLLAKDPNCRLCDSKQLRFGMIEAKKQWMKSGSDLDFLVLTKSCDILPGLEKDIENQKPHEEKSKDIHNIASRTHIVSQTEYNYPKNNFTRNIAIQGTKIIKLTNKYKRNFKIVIILIFIFIYYKWSNNSNGHNDEFSVDKENVSPRMHNNSFQGIIEEADILYELGKYKEAFEKYLVIANGGNIVAQFKLGKMYEEGIGVKKNSNTAAEWYQKSAAKGNAFAQFNLGNFYRTGEGVKQDYTQALKWYQKSADQGNSSAQYFLGYMYENGLGVERNENKASYYYSKAAQTDGSGLY